MSILVVGSTGYLGKKITSSLLSSNLNVTLLIRSQSRNKPDVLEFEQLGAKIIQGDLESLEDIENALTGCEYVVSATFKVEHEKNLFTVIQKHTSCKIKCYIPSFWRPDPQNLEKGENSSWDNKRNLLNLIQSSSIPTIIIFCGLFLDSPSFVGVDLFSNRVCVYGDGNQPIPCIHTSDLASLIPIVLQNPDYVGETLHIEGDRYTTNDAITWLSKSEKLTIVNMKESELDELEKYYREFKPQAVMNCLWLKNIFFSKKLLFESDISQFPQIKWIKAKQYFEDWLDGQETVYPE